MDNPQISIIIPVYNASTYIERCLDSIVCQTYIEWELILVNDGSTDLSGRICDEYVSKDSRIRVIHKVNGGVSSARNAGLSVIKGKYVYFSDADDTLELDALLIMYRAIINKEYALVIAGYNKYDEQGTKIFSMNNSCIEVISHETALEEMFVPKNHNYQGYLWNKLFRKDIIQETGLRFDEQISFNEDRLFITQYLCASVNDVAYTTTPVYNYFVRSSGAMGSLERDYNPLYATEFIAFVKMKTSIFSYTKNRRLRNFVLRAICESYYHNHKMMILNDRYDVAIHARMFKELIRHKAIMKYFSIMLRPVLIHFLLLFFPKLLVKIKRRHLGHSDR